MRIPALHWHRLYFHSMPDKPSVLLVEDDRDMRTLIRIAAQRAECFSSIQVASDGIAALDMLTAATEHGASALPDIIVTDLKMAGVNGVELIRTVKAHPQWRHLPVAVLTSSDLTEDRTAAEAAGGCGYFVKPSNVATLIEIMKSVPGICAAAQHSTANCGFK
jgi:CheY-like chemotaxis protein